MSLASSLSGESSSKRGGVRQMQQLCCDEQAAVALQSARGNSRRAVCFVCFVWISTSQQYYFWRDTRHHG
jgi:hypothetical protein